MSYKISVIIPTFNRNIECLRALNSVLAQTYPCEIIVVDDGSDEPFKFLGNTGIHELSVIRHKTNMGVSSARNNAISKSTGDTLCFLDSDDYWLPQKIEIQLQLYKSFSGECPVASGWLRKNTQGQKQPIIPREPRQQREYFMGCWHAPGSTLLISRKIFEKCGPFNERLNRLEDYEWFIRFGSIGGQLKIVAKPLAVISRGHQQADYISKRNAEKILINWRNNINAEQLQLMRAYLELENSVEAFKNHRYLSSIHHLARSWIFEPRLQLHLSNWWS